MLALLGPQDDDAADDQCERHRNGANSTRFDRIAESRPRIASGRNAMNRFSAKRRAPRCVNNERATSHSFTRYSQHTARIAAPWITMSCAFELIAPS